MFTYYILYLHVYINIVNTKLTLSIDESVISKAKAYAKTHQVSLSRLIENYLSHLYQKTDEKIAITPLVKNLSGVIELPDDYDYKEEYTKHLSEKYQ